MVQKVYGTDIELFYIFVYSVLQYLVVLPINVKL